MRVLLVNPPIYYRQTYGKRPVYPYSPPMGIALMAPMLRARGHEVRLADMTYWSAERVARVLDERTWDVVGMTVLTEQRQGARRLCELVRDRCPGARIVLGGAHATLMAQQVLQHWKCDAVVLGEGEVVLPNLVDAFERKRPIGEVLGVAFLDERGRFVRTPFQPQATDLDALPFPDYREFDLASYDLWTSFVDYTTRRDSRESISLITSRGCTARCQFCSTFVVWKGAWRARSPIHVVDEMERLHRDHGKRFFNIADDVFTTDQERVIGICREILRRKLDVVWDCETRVTDVGSDMLRWMARAGCCTVAFGVESVGEVVLRRMKKGIEPEDVYRAFRLTREAGMRTKAMLMIGNPGEGQDSIDATCEFVERAEPDLVQAAITMVFPGTQLHGWAARLGFINDDYWLSDKPAPYNTAEFPLRSLQRWEAQLLTAQATGVHRQLRRLRTAAEGLIGVRIGRRGIDLYRGPLHLGHWEFPFARRSAWFRSELARPKRRVVIPLEAEAS